MNSIFRKIAGLDIKKSIVKKSSRKVYPFTAAFKNGGVFFEVADGVKSLQDFPDADVLNIIHKNGKITVIKRLES